MIYYVAIVACSFIVMIVDAITHDKQTDENDMTRNAKKTNAQSNEMPSIVLKTIHDDIMKSNANATITTKKMRVKLRATMREVHVANASWIFTRSQYDVVRAMFDDAYAQKIARAQKRETSSRVRVKRDAIVNVVAHDETNDA